MPKKSGTGIIIGRFQVFEINPIVKELISSVSEKHERVVLFLGSSPAPSDHNPIDWPFRWQMFTDEYGKKIEVYEMPDLPDDRIWSQELDRRILEIKPEGNVVLYGTTHNFIERYSGKYPTEPLEAAEIPEDINLEGIKSMRDFRAGMVYAALRRFPTVYPTVDIAVFRNDYREIMLARKENETKFRFPGGFSDPDDESFEEAILRELGEECGELEIKDLIYLGSSKMEDWRYKQSMDSIITHLYACELVNGDPKPDDDIAEIRWFDTSKLKAELFVTEHRPLVKLLEAFLYEDR